MLVWYDSNMNESSLYKIYLAHEYSSGAIIDALLLDQDRPQTTT